MHAIWLALFDSYTIKRYENGMWHMYPILYTGTEAILWLPQHQWSMAGQ